MRSFWTSPVGVMLAVSVGSWLVVAGLVGRQTAGEALMGMLAPLVATAGSWLLTERTYNRDRERLTARMVGAFAAKMVFFGAYVAVMLRVLMLRPVPFVVSFTSYFITLYLIEALCLRRLFAGG